MIKNYMHGIAEISCFTPIDFRETGMQEKGNEKRE
jgi:hypothetical protein